MDSNLSIDTHATDENKKYRYNVFHNKSFLNDDNPIEYANFVIIFEISKKC